jgi:glucokinase
VSAVLAIDVGGTSIKAASVDRTGALLRRTERHTPVADGPDAVVTAVRSVAADFAADGIAAAAAVVPGAVDAAAGVARYAANLGWRDVPLRELLGSELAVPVALGHDVRDAARAEAVLGRARGTENVLVVVIGTGIAGLIRSGGHTVRGARDLAGEIGHMAVWPDGERCACGQLGCLETYASGAAIARRYRHLGGAGGALDAREIAARQSGDALAARVWTEAVDALGIALAAYTMLLDPEAIVLGGGLSEAGETLLAPVRTALERRLTWRPPPTVHVSPLGARAGLLGAAMLAWEQIGGADFESWQPPAEQR